MVSKRFIYSSKREEDEEERRKKPEKKRVAGKKRKSGAGDGLEPWNMAPRAGSCFLGLGPAR